MILIKFVVKSHVQQFNNLEEFLEFDRQLHKDAYSPELWYTTIVEAVNCNRIINEFDEWFDSTSQEYVSTYFAEDINNAHIFLDSFSNSDTFQKSLKASEEAGFSVTTSVHDYAYQSTGRKIIS